MLNQLSSILQQDCLLEPGKTVLVGVSGGADSLTLLDILHRLGYPVVIAHFNHHLRLQAAADAEAVQQVAESLSAPFILGEADVAAFSAAHMLSIEEAARILRYRFLFAQAAAQSAQAVAVAHTADDQVETVLMHLLRGSGLSGLKGMPPRALPNAWSEDIPLARPLLSIWRREIDAYCLERGLQPVFDHTNLDTTYYRNRLRHELIPFLEGYNAQVKSLLWRTTCILAADHEVLAQQVGAAWQACFLEQGAGFVAWRSETFAAQPLALRRGLLRRGIAALRPGLRDIDFETVERGLAFLTHPPPAAQCNLAAGLRLLLEGNRLWLATWEADLPAGDWPQCDGSQQALDAPGQVYLAGGWRFSVTTVNDPALALRQAAANADPYRAWIALDDLPPGLALRTRRPGDRFHPLGLEGHSLKLSDLMINVKVPTRARAGWPLVCAGDAIVWLPGYRLSHLARLTPDSQHILALQLTPPAA